MTARIQVLRESREAPVEFQKLLRDAVGVNPFGEAMYRFVWGQNRSEWIGGKWQDRDEHGILIREVTECRFVLKYAPPLFKSDRWYVERWYPPSVSKEQWAVKSLVGDDGGPNFSYEDAFGPYPSRGRYQHFFTVEGPEPECAFRELTRERAKWLADLAWSSEHAAKKTLQQEKDALAEKERAASAHNIEEMDEQVPAFVAPHEFVL